MLGLVTMGKGRGSSDSSDSSDDGAFVVWMGHLGCGAGRDGGGRRMEQGWEIFPRVQLCFVLLAELSRATVLFPYPRLRACQERERQRYSFAAGGVRARARARARAREREREREREEEEEEEEEEGQTARRFVVQLSMLCCLFSARRYGLGGSL